MKTYKVIVVNEEDQEVGLKAYDNISHEDINRVSALWLTDRNSGDVLLTQRNLAKHNDPGKWMAAVSGTIEEGETYGSNIIKETLEEIGLTNLRFSEGPKNFIDDGKHRFFVQWFTAKVDKDGVDIKIQDDEVETYAWVPEHQVLKDVLKNPEKYVPSMLKDLKSLGVM